MFSVYHEGEKYIQSLMGVSDEAEDLSSMIQKKIPSVASDFLKTLRFGVIALSIDNEKVYTTLVYSDSCFITEERSDKIIISLEHYDYIDEQFFEAENLKIGFIGLDFEKAMRVRINGFGKIKGGTLSLEINEIYSNCPRHIHKRVLQTKFKDLGKVSVLRDTKMSTACIDVIKKADTFFLASSHARRELDVSHKGGEVGFVNLVSSSKLIFEDTPGNNMFNSLGNIHTNSFSSLLFIDFEHGITYHLQGKAEVKESAGEEKKNLHVHFQCDNLIEVKNSFRQNYI